jgi:hypothetical protein
MQPSSQRVIILRDTEIIILMGFLQVWGHSVSLQGTTRRPGNGLLITDGGMLPKRGACRLFCCPVFPKQLPLAISRQGVYETYLLRPSPGFGIKCPELALTFFLKIEISGKPF